jgi:hypothetical protein
VTSVAGDGAVGNFFGHDERPQKLRSEFVLPLGFQNSLFAIDSYMQVSEKQPTARPVRFAYRYAGPKVE